jgi:threonine dehydratase
MVTVETDEICAAIKLGFNDTRCVMEPAGALGIAGMVKYIQSNRCKDKTFVAITSGANMDFDRLRFVSERADSSEVLCSIQIPERPGTFREMHAVLSPRNITELCYRHNGTNKANVFVTYQTLAGIERDLDKKNVRDELAIKGYGILLYARINL